MSVEHGGNHEKSFGDIIATLFLAFLIFPYVITVVEETVEEITTGGAGGHGGH